MPQFFQDPNQQNQQPQRRPVQAMPMPQQIRQDQPMNPSQQLGISLGDTIRVNIPGVGDRDFPKSMKPEEIYAAGKRLQAEAMQKEGEPTSIFGKLQAGLRDAAPEIVGGLTSIALPASTSGFGMAAVPAVTAGLTEAVKQWADTTGTDQHPREGNLSEVDPSSVMWRGALNAVPGFISSTRTGARIASAAREMAPSQNWLGTLARGVLGFTTTPQTAIESAPAAVKAAAAVGGLDLETKIQLLTEKLSDPKLNTTAKAAVYTALKKVMALEAARNAGGISNALRILLGFGNASGATGIAPSGAYPESGDELGGGR